MYTYIHLYMCVCESDQILSGSFTPAARHILYQYVCLGRSGPNLELGKMRVYVTNGPRSGLHIGRQVGPCPGSRRRWVLVSARAFHQAAHAANTYRPRFQVRARPSYLHVSACRYIYVCISESDQILSGSVGLTVVFALLLVFALLFVSHRCVTPTRWSAYCASLRLRQSAPPR